MRHLGRRMHARVGTPCAMQSYDVACDLGNGPFEMVLHGSPVALTLPAFESISSIFHTQRNPFHHAHHHSPTPAITNIPSTQRSSAPKRSRSTSIASCRSLLSSLIQ